MYYGKHLAAVICENGCRYFFVSRSHAEDGGKLGIAWFYLGVRLPPLRCTPGEALDFSFRLTDGYKIRDYYKMLRKDTMEQRVEAGSSDIARAMSFISWNSL